MDTYEVRINFLSPSADAETVLDYLVLIIENNGGSIVAELPANNLILATIEIENFVEYSLANLIAFHLTMIAVQSNVHVEKFVGE